MTYLRKAAQQALEALASYSAGERLDASQVNDLIVELDAALEQQAEPPPEWPLIKNILDEYGLQAIDFVAEFKAAQRQWVGLTDEEISSLWDGHIVPVFGKNGINPIVFARAIEAKLREKNT